ncbi:hypothetical protein PFISCL1PPCAC_8723, partial [Pristionchus fissidentatus]
SEDEIESVTMAPVSRNKKGARLRTEAAQERNPGQSLDGEGGGGREDERGDGERKKPRIDPPLEELRSETWEGRRSTVVPSSREHSL